MEEIDGSKVRAKSESLDSRSNPIVNSQVGSGQKHKASRSTPQVVVLKWAQVTLRPIDLDEWLAKASELLSQVQGMVLEAERHLRAIGDKAIEAEWQVRVVEVCI